MRNCKILSLLLPVLSVALLLLLGSTPPSRAAGTGDDQDKQKKKEERARVFGTVFNRQGYALRGITVTARHKDAKKPKWKTVTAARGEFVLYLPPASGDYEIRAASKKHQNQSKEVTILGEDKLNLFFRLKPLPEEKKE